MTLMDALRWALAALIPALGCCDRMRSDSWGCRVGCALMSKRSRHRRHRQCECGFSTELLSLIDRYRSPWVIDSADASFPLWRFF